MHFSVDLFSLLEEHCDKILEANVLLDQLCQGNAPETPSVTESCRLLMDIVCAAVRLKAGCAKMCTIWMDGMGLGCSGCRLNRMEYLMSNNSYFLE
jgi:hypothetical protein